MALSCLQGQGKDSKSEKEKKSWSLYLPWTWPIWRDPSQQKILDSLAAVQEGQGKVLEGQKELKKDFDGLLAKVGKVEKTAGDLVAKVDRVERGQSFLLEEVAGHQAQEKFQLGKGRALRTGTQLCTCIVDKPGSLDEVCQAVLERLHAGVSADIQQLYLLHAEWRSLQDLDEC